MMKITGQLALAQLRTNRRRTLLTLLGIVLAGAMVTAVFGFAQSGIKAVETAIRAYGDYHVVWQALDPQDAAAIAADPEIESSYTEPSGETEAESYGPDTVSLFARLVAPSGDAMEQAWAIAERHGVPLERIIAGTNTELLAIEGHLPNYLARGVHLIMVVLLAVIVAASVIVVSNAFRVSVAQRTRQFGVLKSVGATSRQIRRTVLAEGLWLSLLGIPLGIGLGLGLEAAAMPVMNALLKDLNALNQRRIDFNFAISGWGLALAALLGFVTVILSVWWPARRAAQKSAIEAIRGTAEVKLTSRQLRTTGLTRRLFGFEGELAAKAMRRDRRGYRATVVSLAASVVLFVVSASFGTLLLTANATVYPSLSVTASASYAAPGLIVFDHKQEQWNGNSQGGAEWALSPDLTRQITEQLRQFDSADVTLIATDMTEAVLDTTTLSSTTDLFTTAGSRLLVDHFGRYIPVQRIMVDPQFYDRLCQQAGVQLGQAIVINQARSDSDGRIKLIEPLTHSVDRLVIDLPEGQTTLSVGGQLTEIPPALSKFLADYSINLIVPQVELVGTARWWADVPDAAGFVSYAEQTVKAMTQQQATATTTPASARAIISTSNIAEQNAAVQGLSTLIMTFIYGFIAMLTLIGLTNVVSTILTNLNLRQAEFAILISNGLTRSGLRRILTLESLMVAGRALLFGLPLGVGLSFGLYLLIGDVVTAPYHFPWWPVLICLIAVPAVTWLTMRLSSAKLGRGSIVEHLRGEH
ncbi:MAG: ABC transporter permease [Propionibacteriaceae bacterium]|jgi:putative ABC transport system permease protein|nr:ABC transporter permease [Propionibacteriaceae bacterium]